MTNEKHFLKTISHWEFDYGLLKDLPIIILTLTTFLQVHANSKEVSYLSWQNMYPNLKTTCHIKLKLFLWTKLLVKLFLAKYLISVAAPLMIDDVDLKMFHYDELIWQLNMMKALVMVNRMSPVIIWKI